jgi:lysophospholipase L1-like esterase
MSHHRRTVALAAAATALAAALLPTVGGPAAGAGAGPGSGAPSCSATRWVAGWSASPTDGLVNVPPVEQTYRIQVVPRLDGDRARLRLSNRFGLGPVTFGKVTLGVQRAGAALVPGTVRAVTFGGRTRTRVAKGADVLSDPVDLAVVRDRVLLASVYVVGMPGPATQHVLAGQTTWQSAPGSGDRTTSETGAGFVGLPVPGLTPALTQGIPYLNGLEVESDHAHGAVVAFGDSITDGFQGTVVPLLPAAEPIDRHGRYPDVLAARVRDAGLPLSVVNAGISGNQLLKNALLPIFGPSGLSRFDRDALDQAGATTVILLEGINDIGQSFAKAPALIAGYRAAILRAHARGLRILLGTLTPDEGTLQPGYGSMGEAPRVAVNAWIRSQTLSDGIIDFDAAVRDPAHPTRLLPAYNGGDNLHFSPAGYRAMAAAVPLSALTAPVCG